MMKSPRTIPIALLLFLVHGLAYGASVQQINLDDLIEHSDVILVGHVAYVTDGIDNGIPYTEVTVKVRDQVMGSTGDFYTFRQFGLMAPRDMGDGRVNLNVSPDGWPRFELGKEVMLFLPVPSSLGLCTTVGLFQGKFDIEGGGVSNKVGNQGLFEKVSPGNLDLTEAEQKLLQAGTGKVPVNTFVSLVRKMAIQKTTRGGK